jgi:hypothetical protein
MLDLIYLENDQVIVHTVRPQELERYETIIKEIHQIFSDGGTLEFLPKKRLRSVSDAENWLKITILNFHCGNNFLHFITDKKSGKLLGMVDIFAPSTIRACYKIHQPPYFIEFYLRSSAKRGNSGRLDQSIPSALGHQVVFAISKIQLDPQVINRDKVFRN